MTTKAALLATFVDFRTVKTRKCLQLIFEVPFENDAANKALDALGGVPSPSDPPWVGIARVVIKPASEPPEPVARPSRNWADLAPAQQAGIRCGEKAFAEFLDGFLIMDTSGMSPAEMIRDYCDVDSRAEIKPGTRAEQRWNLLESTYQSWLTEAQYVEAVR